MQARHNAPIITNMGMGLLMLILISGVSFVSAGDKTMSFTRNSTFTTFLHMASPVNIMRTFRNTAHTLPQITTKIRLIAYPALTSIPTDLASGITVFDTMPQLALVSPQAPDFKYRQIPQGIVLGVNAAASDSIEKKATLPFLDRISLSVYCLLSPLSSILDTSKCDYNVVTESNMETTEESTPITTTEFASPSVEESIPVVQAEPEPSSEKI